MWGYADPTPGRACLQGNANGIQMAMIHEITVKGLRLCKHGLQWDQPWMAQLQEGFDRREGNKAAWHWRSKIFPGIRASWRSEAKGMKGKRWKSECQEHLSHQKGARWRGAVRTSDLVQSQLFVAVSHCHVLFVLGQAERTCPALLREVIPYSCLVQARGGKLYHICAGFKSLFGFVCSS